jgi:uncharacterized damage-inducible protein DinB
MTSMADRYRRWFQYEKEVHQKTLASLRTVPEARRAEPSFDRAVTLLAHLAGARELWLHRFGVRETAPTTEEEFFPRGASIAAVEARLERIHEEWSDYLGSLDESELARVFDYRALEGGRFRNRVEDLLTQLFGHSWYHRGQIASLVRELGGVPAATDYVFWVREPVE